MRQAAVAAVVATAAVAAAVLVPLAVTGHLGGDSHRATPTAPPYFRHPVGACGHDGCAVVNVVRASPQPTVFYGASCAGLAHRWFLNITEAGGSGVLRPSYKLEWSFENGVSTAKPDGTVVVKPAGGETAALNIASGSVSLSGTNAAHQPVTASGTLTVAISGTPAAPTLTFAETGLSAAEQQLGLSSPFDVAGQPLTVPVKLVDRFSSC